MTKRSSKGGEKMFGVRVFIGCTALLISGGAQAMECGTSALQSKDIHAFPGFGYWMQAAGDCRITYTGLGGLGSKMYNTCTRKSENITPYLDAYPVPGVDGELYVHPFGGISFYRVKDALDKGVNAAPFFNDEKLNGNYESVGVLESVDGKASKIRVAMGNAAGLYKDYKLEKTDDKYKVTPLHKEPVEICQNVAGGGLDTEIPMLARNGQMISGRDYRSRKTKIYRIKPTDGSTADCSEVATIPTQTSKVSFGYDNKHVMYVIQDPRTGQGRLMEFDLETKKARTLSGPNEDVMYTSYKEDGTLLYTRRNRGSDGSELVMMDPATVAPPNPNDAKKFEAIGHLWGMACNQTLDSDMAAAVGIRLAKKNCAELLRDESFSKLGTIGDQYKTIEKSDLSSICGGSGDAGASSGAGAGATGAPASNGTGNK